MVAPRPAVRSRRSLAPLRADRGWLTAAAVAKATGGEILQRGDTALGVVTDSRRDVSGQLFVALRGEQHDGHDHVQGAVGRGAHGVVVDRPIATRMLPEGVFAVRVADTGAALMDLASAHRRRSRAQIVGITGSCGKTSTKEMLGQVVASAMPTVRSPASYNNHVGVPLTLFQLQASTCAAVVEIGTNGPGEIAALSAVAAPDVGIVTCVSEAHLSGLGSLEGIAEEKSALIKALPATGLAILNGDDGSCRAMASATRAAVQWVRIDREADWFATDVRFSGIGTCFRLNGDRPVTLPRLGTHNVYNALFTIAAAARLGMELDPILERLAEIPAAERRLECKRFGDVLVFDDTYNMNPSSARAALHALAGLPGDGRRVVVFGEMLELGKDSRRLHEELGREVARTGQDVLVCVGDGAQPIAEGARDAGMAPDRVRAVDDPSAALALLLESLHSGDRLLCKASRRVALDRLVDGLQHKLTPAADGDGADRAAGGIG